jgi:hypothetical protein
MNNRPELLLVLLLFGVALLANQAKLPHWLLYTMMLAILGGTYYLAPEWFAGRSFRLLALACAAVAGIGLALELVSLALT